MKRQGDWDIKVEELRLVPHLLSISTLPDPLLPTSYGLRWCFSLKWLETSSKGNRFLVDISSHHPASQQ
ncbi:hypothetical protein AV530_016082 [Patagioenas fasciata monilis]|uniref:Uncharacterized protein n=1 Tax=Patagioenas fasciata monilis TaxID=372326 RepID=A0A1V4KJY3_PATFA|nr:hypothetical protein AV530_016082 [Patagioenas fasciata monilis]